MPLIFTTRLVALPVAVLLSICILRPALGHEYWIEPVSHTTEVGAKVVASIRNGENYDGVSYGFNPGELASASRHTRTRDIPLQGRLGDFPAINFEATEPGYQMLVLQTNPSTLDYTSDD